MRLDPMFSWERSSSVMTKINTLGAPLVLLQASET
jgi:hypothetical protein